MWGTGMLPETGQSPERPDGARRGVDMMCSLLRTPRSLKKAFNPMALKKYL